MFVIDDIKSKITQNSSEIVGFLELSVTNISKSHVRIFEIHVISNHIIHKLSKLHHLLYEKLHSSDETEDKIRLQNLIFVVQWLVVVLTDGFCDRETSVLGNSIRR